MGHTVDGDALRDTHTEPHVHAAAGDLTVEHQEPLPPGATGNQVAVGDIPSEPPGFRPRASLLTELDRSSAGVSVLHALRGLNGLGTTQLAAAYARMKLAAGWRLVAWVNGADTGSLRAGLAAVADAAGLTDVDSGRATIDPGAAVRHWLETDGDRCLLVFDDVSDPEILRPYVPAGGPARILITSNRQSVADLGSTVPVDVLSASEASAFLAGRAGPDNEAVAAAVAAELGYLALALALAAPVISEQRHGYARYLEQLQATQADVSLTGYDGRPYPQSVARAVLLSMAAIRASDKTGICARLMTIMAVLPAAGVRRELLHAAGRAGILASGGRRVEATVVDQVLEWLSDRSLLTSSLDGQTVRMHRLIAQVVRHGLVHRRRLGAVCWVAASVVEAYAIAQAGSQDHLAVRRIPQLVTALLDNTAELAGEADEELAGILLRLRFLALYHLIELGDSASQAIAIGEPLTADLERLLGPGHPDTLNARNSLAAAYLAANRVADAIAVFEQTLAIFERQLGPDHPDTLTSRNNLANAYQDAGRIAEAIQLFELTLAERERALGADHPSTLTSQGNLAAAYQAAGRTAEAIPLLEQTMAGRGRVLGPDHPDTQTTRQNLAKAYQDAGRSAEAIPLLEQISAGRRRVLRPSGWTLSTSPPAGQTPASRASQAPADVAAKARLADFRRPPADSARPALPASFRRPPVDQAGRLPADGAAATRAKLPDRSFARPTQETSVSDGEHDRVAGAAIAAGDPAGLKMAYDRHAAALYGYCHWLLGDPADAAESLQDTFILTAAMRGDRSGPGQLRPWLFALARNECRRRVRPGSAIRDAVDIENRPANDGEEVGQVSRPAGAADALADAIGSFPVVSDPLDAIDDLAEATMQFPAVVSSPDATMQFGMASVAPKVIRPPADATMQFGMASVAPKVIRPPADATVQIVVGGPLADATMQFRMFRESPDATDALADVSGYVGQTELRGLIRSVLADMKPREREVIELSFRHDLSDDDLSVVLGASRNRTHALAARTRGRLEKSFGTLRAALVGRQACPVVAELLADWDGQLSEQTRDLVAWHMEQCPTCQNNTQGALRPTVLSGLLPLAPLPPELREKVLSRCSSAAEDAVAYRRRVVRRAEARWAALFSAGIKQLSWSSIRANPGAAIATTAVTVWAAAAVSVLLFTFAGPHAAHALAIRPTASPSTHIQTADPSTGIPATSPAVASTTPSARRSPSRRPQPVVQPSTYVSYQVQPSPSPSPVVSKSPSKSPSPTPSKSPSAKPSGSPSTSPSHSPTASPSSSPSPTA